MQNIRFANDHRRVTKFISSGIWSPQNIRVSMSVIKQQLWVTQFTYKQGQIQTWQSLKHLQFGEPSLRKTNKSHFHVGQSGHIPRPSQNGARVSARRCPSQHARSASLPGGPGTYCPRGAVPLAHFVCRFFTKTCRDRCLCPVLFLRAIMRLEKYALDESVLWLAGTHVHTFFIF